MADTVFLGVPTHDGRIDIGTSSGSQATHSEKHVVITVPHVLSLTSTNCNALLCLALNEYEQGQKFQWWAMLHSDVQPPAWWIDTAIDLANEHDADMVSAYIPIKDGRGLTSTAIEHPETPWHPWCRPTLKQIWSKDFPETADINTLSAALGAPASRLLVNTGCCIVRFDREWMLNGSVYFDQKDRIVKLDGQWKAQVQSEDWQFSRRLLEAGGKIVVTRKIRTLHRGVCVFDSGAQWGQDVDDDCIRHRVLNRTATAQT